MPKCPCCEKEITVLKVYANVVMRYTLGADGIEFNHEVLEGNPSYKCPECGSPLFLDRESALEFLRTRQT